MEKSLYSAPQGLPLDAQPDIEIEIEGDAPSTNTSDSESADLRNSRLEPLRSVA